MATGAGFQRAVSAQDRFQVLAAEAPDEFPPLRAQPHAELVLDPRGRRRRDFLEESGFAGLRVFRKCLQGTPGILKDLLEKTTRG